MFDSPLKSMFGNKILPYKLNFEETRLQILSQIQFVNFNSKCTKSIDLI